MVASMEVQDLGTCFIDGSVLPDPDPVSNACNCTQGWQGPECNICETARACRGMIHYQGIFPVKRLNCVRDMAVIEQTQGVCRVATSRVNKFLKGQSFVTTTISGDGDLHLEFVKVSVITKSLIH